MKFKLFNKHGWLPFPASPFSVLPTSNSGLLNALSFCNSVFIVIIYMEYMHMF